MRSCKACKLAMRLSSVVDWTVYLRCGYMRSPFCLYVQPPKIFNNFVDFYETWRKSYVIVRHLNIWFPSEAADLRVVAFLAVSLWECLKQTRHPLHTYYVINQCFDVVLFDVTRNLMLPTVSNGNMACARTGGRITFVVIDLWWRGKY